jgi:hypothetical protein
LIQEETKLSSSNGFALFPSRSGGIDGFGRREYRFGPTLAGVFELVAVAFESFLDSWAEPTSPPSVGFGDLMARSMLRMIR